MHSKNVSETSYNEDSQNGGGQVILTKNEQSEAKSLEDT